MDSSEPRGDLAEVLALPLEAVLLAPAERLKHSRPLKDLELQDLFRNLKNPESTAAAFYPEPNCSTKPFTNLFWRGAAVEQRDVLATFLVYLHDSLDRRAWFH